MITDIAILFATVFAQNASFTLVSRARNTSSLPFHAIAAVFSNGIWLLVIRQVVQNLDSWVMMVTYLVASVVGSVTMHEISMRFFEKGKRRIGG